VPPHLPHRGESAAPPPNLRASTPRQPSFDAKADNPFAAIGAPTYRYVCLSRPGPGREINEDTFMVKGQLLGDPTLSLYAVFDGHGGTRASRHCAKTIGGEVAARLSPAMQPARRGPMPDQSEIEINALAAVANSALGLARASAGGDSNGNRTNAKSASASASASARGPQSESVSKVA